GGMKRGDFSGQSLYLIGAYFVALNALLERDLLGEAHHLHCPFDGLALGFHMEPCSGPNHRHHSQIHGWRETAIQANLFLAEMMAFLKCAEVQKTHLN